LGRNVCKMIALLSLFSRRLMSSDVAGAVLGLAAVGSRSLL